MADPTVTAASSSRRAVEPIPVNGMPGVKPPAIQALRTLRTANTVVPTRYLTGRPVPGGRMRPISESAAGGATSIGRSPLPSFFLTFA